jgi:transcriptional regulator with XRE-family HTH domain
VSAIVKRLGRRVRDLRDKRQMTQAALAAKAGISREYLARLEIGRHEPTLSTLQALAKALRVKVGGLL